MDKTKTNYIIDIFMLIAFIITTITSLILYFVFPSGNGSGKLVVWGTTKQLWSGIHTYIGFAFIILMLLHFILHWNWMKCMTKSMFKKQVIEKNTEKTSKQKKAKKDNKNKCEV